MNKTYPVGSVCVLVKFSPFPELVGTELTITGAPYEYVDAISNKTVVGYPTDLQYGGYNIHPIHDVLRLKRLPPSEDAWCRDVMAKITGNAPLSSKGDFLIVKETQ